MAAGRVVIEPDPPSMTQNRCPAQTLLDIASSALDGANFKA
jgi:hypothetical protein